jgi:hypothetical protein
MLKFTYKSTVLSINNYMEKIKQFIETDKGKDVLVVIIIILVGLGSFELGRLSKESSNTGINVEYGDQGANVINATENENTVNTDISNNQKIISKSFFASSRGSKYYSISCGAGKTIKEENRVYFNTSTEAEKAGYTLSSSCK